MYSKICCINVPVNFRHILVLVIQIILIMLERFLSWVYVLLGVMDPCILRFKYYKHYNYSETWS